MKLTELVIASHNKGKIDELTSALTPLGLKVYSAKDFNLDSPEETADTYLENATIKADFVMAATGLPTLADDSGIEITALGGKPGVHSAPFAEELGGYEALFDYLAAHPGVQKNPTATCVCLLLLKLPDGQTFTYEARVKGRLHFPPHGNRLFGYDPIFWADGAPGVYATLTQKEKFALGHRGAAFRQMLDDLKRRVA